MAVDQQILEPPTPYQLAVNKRAKWKQAIIRFIRHKPLGAVGAGIVLFMILMLRVNMQHV